MDAGYLRLAVQTEGPADEHPVRGHRDQRAGAAELAGRPPLVRCTAVGLATQ